MTTVVWAHSGEANAPVLNNANGSLDALLHAMLVTGWNLQTASGVVVTSNVATVTLAGHGYSNNRVVEVSGATPSGLNGRKRITVVNANTFTFAAPGIPDGAATGTVSVKRASLGWTRPHSSGNVSIYARSDVTATAMMLRVNDSGANGASATHARALMVWGAVTDVNTFAERAPLDSAVSGGLWWGKGPNSASAKPWALIGNEKCFYLFTDDAGYPSSSYGNVGGTPFFFGDLTSFRPSDAFACVITGAPSANPCRNPAYCERIGTSPTSDGWIARASYGVGAPVGVGPVGNQGGGYMGGNGPMYPSPVDGGLVIQAPVLATEGVGSFSFPVRGVFPGLGNPLTTLPAGLLNRVEFPNLNGQGRDWVLLAGQYFGTYAHLAFDTTGPW